MADGLIRFTGRAGGFWGPEMRMCCTLDAILQAILRNPRCATRTRQCPQIARLAIIARRLGAHADCTMYVYAAWAATSAYAWTIGEPRPELMEYPLYKGNGTTVNIGEAKAHKSWGPPNTLWITIATSHPHHVVSITWVKEDGSTTTMVAINPPGPARITSTYREQPLLHLTPHLLFGYETATVTDHIAKDIVAKLHQRINLPVLTQAHEGVVRHMTDVQSLVKDKGVQRKPSTVTVIQVSDEHADEAEARSEAEATACSTDIMLAWNKKICETRGKGIVWATRLPHSETEPLQHAIIALGEPKLQRKGPPLLRRVAPPRRQPHRFPPSPRPLLAVPLLEDPLEASGRAPLPRASLVPPLQQHHLAYSYR